MKNLIRNNLRLLVPLLRQTSTWKCCQHINQIPMPRSPHSIQLSQIHIQHFLCTNQTNEQDPVGAALLDVVTYETVATDTLEGLCEYFEDLVESTAHLKNADINYSDGVLTVNFGRTHGTYVINRQSPNRQIWLSSPTSGPKRYDFIDTTEPSIRGNTNRKGYWIYKHDQRTLHELLQNEIKTIVGKEVDFFNLPFGRKEN